MKRSINCFSARANRIGHVAVICGIACVAELAIGQTSINWVETNGDYGNASNWSPVNVPDNSGEAAILSINSTYQVDLDQDYTVNDLRVLDGSVTLAPDASFTATYSATDDVVIEDSTLRLVGVAGAGQSGTLNLSVGDELGIAANGQLEIADGRTVTTNFLRLGAKNQSGLAGQSGTLLIDGPGSSLSVTDPSFVGAIGASLQTGILQLSNSATADFAGVLSVATSATNGVVGDVSLFSGSDLTAAGGFNLAAGSGANATGSLLLDGVGTTFSTNGSVELGSGSGASAASVTVQNDATFTQNGPGGLLIGGSSGGSTQVSISSRGGFATGAGGTTIGANGSLAISGGLLAANGGLDNSAGGTLTQTGGVLSVTGGLLRPNSGQPDAAISFTPDSNDYTISGPAGINAPETRINAGASLNSGDDLYVGFNDSGTLTITDGGQATADFAYAGLVNGGGAAEGGILVSGQGSSLTATAVILGGDVASATGQSVGILGVVDDASVSLENLTVERGFAASQTIVVGPGSTLSADGVSLRGVVDVSAGGSVQSDNATVFNEGVATITGASSSWSAGVVSFRGVVNVSAGGSIQSDQATVFDGGVATITGASSSWSVTGALSIGASGSGLIDVNQGGAITAASLRIGTGSNGETRVSGVGSEAVISGSVEVGLDGQGVLRVESGGVVTAGAGAIDADAPGPGASSGSVVVTGNGSLWSVNGDLDAGTLGGQAQLSINDGGLVIVSGQTRIGPSGAVDLAGGRFEFGETDFQSLGRVGGTSGSLAGSLPLVGFNDAEDVANALPLSLQNPALDFSEVSLVNRGFLFGSGVLELPLVNESAGEVSAATSERLRLASGLNHGQITLTGGTVHHTGAFANNPGGLVIGNGTLRADGGTTNDGTLALSATANVVGDVMNNASGLITSSGGTTSFFDDVINNGEIRTNAGSFSVYFGSYSGAGDTGTGTVIMQGDLKPGSSPGLMAFGGNLVLGDQATTEIEIGGRTAGTQFDQIAVVDELQLNGDLTISLIDGFVPSLGDTFDVATAKAITGLFDSVTLPGAGFELIYSSTAVQLIATSGLAGDYNNDGTIDAADYTVWRDNLNAPGGTLLNDTAGGVIGSAQYGVWVANFGATLSTSVQVVPEPSAVTLLAVIFALGLSGRRSNIRVGCIDFGEFRLPQIR